MLNDHFRGPRRSHVGIGPGDGWATWGGPGVSGALRLWICSGFCGRFGTREDRIRVFLRDQRAVAWAAVIDR